MAVHQHNSYLKIVQLVIGLSSLYTGWLLWRWSHPWWQLKSQKIQQHLWKIIGFLKLDWMNLDVLILWNLDFLALLTAFLVILALDQMLLWILKPGSDFTAGDAAWLQPHGYAMKPGIQLPQELPLALLLLCSCTSGTCMRSNCLEQSRSQGTKHSSSVRCWSHCPSHFPFVRTIRPSGKAQSFEFVYNLGS